MRPRRAKVQALPKAEAREVAEGRAAAHDISHGTLFEVPNCGQIPVLEKLEEFFRALLPFWPVETPVLPVE